MPKPTSTPRMPSARLALAVCLGPGLGCAAVLAQEATATASPELPTEEATQAPSSPPTPATWQYALGLKLKADDVAHPGNQVRLRPVIGLRYGRWRIGQSTNTDWLRFNGFRKDTGLEYDWKDSDKVKVALSLRLQNITENESADGFGPGLKTLRGRASINYRLTPRWSIGTDITQDLLNRGDGSTLTAGVSYLWPLDERSTLSINSGVNWATASHWQTQYRTAPPPAAAWHAGVGGIGAGLSYRYSSHPQWAWFGTVGTSRALGQVNEVSPSLLTWSGQIGLLYFSR